MNEQYKNMALQVIRLYAQDVEFVKQILSTIMASTDNTTVQQVCLDAFIELDE